MTMKSAFAQDGYFLLKNVLSAQQVDALKSELSVFDGQINHYGVRNLMRKVVAIRDLAFSEVLSSIAQEILDGNAKPVRSVYFDKTPDANWNVAWHQDTSIAVAGKNDAQGFTHWSLKDGVVHVEPPEEYLANILTLRIHLDAADVQNGVLRVLPESHRHGRIRSAEILALVANSSVVECIAEAGDILLMSPLLAHASHKAKSSLHRRIIHLEYSAMSLPAGLDWYEQMF